MGAVENSQNSVTSLVRQYGEFYSVDGRSLTAFKNNMEYAGLSVDAADARYIEKNPRSINGDRVTVYDSDGNAYEATFNYYFDGGRELVDFKKKSAK